MECEVDLFAVSTFFGAGFLLFGCSLFTILQRNIKIRWKSIYSALFISMGFYFMNRGGQYLDPTNTDYKTYGLFWVYLVCVVALVFVTSIIDKNQKLKNIYT